MTAETEDDEALQAFFDEVDKLSIKEDSDIQSSVAAATDKDTEEIKTPKRDDVVNTNSKNEKQHVIANAKHNQKAWSEFKKLDLNDNTAGGSGGSDKKISFQIKSSTKDKKRKKKKDKLPPNNVDTTNNTTNTILPINDSSIISLDCPSWTLIIDTCSLLQQNGIQSIHQLIELAKFAITNNTNQTTNQLHTPLYEPISIVIPYVVWGELDYQSKKMNKNNSLEEGEVEKNETNASIARRATRMVRDELELSQQINSRVDVLSSSISNNIVPRSSGVLYSQSIVESNAAADKYLSKEIQSTNDDYILACALMENEKYKQSNTFGTMGSSGSSTGGVVVITLDNNLSCKCLANELKVHSPSTFVEYYEKRMESLKQRAASRLA